MKFLEFIISLFNSPNETKNRTTIYNSGKGAKIKTKTKNIEHHYSFNNVVNVDERFCINPVEHKTSERRKLTLALFMIGSIGVLGGLNLQYDFGILFVLLGLLISLALSKYYVTWIEKQCDKMDVLILPIRKYFLTIIVDQKVDKVSFFSALIINLIILCLLFSLAIGLF